MPVLSKMSQGNGPSMPHNGQMVEELLATRRITKSELARKLGVSPGGVSEYLKQYTLHAALLWKIGHVLNHNFFADLTAAHSTKTTTPLELTQQQQIAALATELAIYKEIMGTER